MQEFTDTAIDFTETRADFDEDGDNGQVGENSAPIVRLVQLIITEAVQLRATHIYLEPQADRVAIFYVINGSRHERDTPPRRLLMAIVRRLQILAKIDPSRSQSPLASGEMQISVGDTCQRIRVYIVSTPEGPSVLLRLANQPCETNDAERLAKSCAAWLNTAQKTCGDDRESRETYQRLIEDCRT